MMFSVSYHNIFDFPLTKEELVRWKIGKQFSIFDLRNQLCCQFPIEHNGDYFFVKGRESIIKTRLLREEISVKKLKIAQKASEILSRIPTVLMVSITGSLAMKNSSKESDIDLMIVVKKNTLWLSRLVILVILFLLHIPVRRSWDLHQSNKLCLNMWMDESDLIWEKSDRNLYTAHEIAQIVPLVNKDKIYERFLYQNKWILDFWPSAVIIKNLKRMHHSVGKIENSTSNGSIFERVAYKTQLFYMRRKISREVVTPTRAIFHPNDWGKVVLSKLNKNNGIF